MEAIKYWKSTFKLRFVFFVVDDVVVVFFVVIVLELAEAACPCPVIAPGSRDVKGNCHSGFWAYCKSKERERERERESSLSTGFQY